MKIAVRYLFFVSNCFLILAIIYWAFGYLMFRFVDLGAPWVLILLILFGLAIWVIFKRLSMLLTYLADKIAIDRNISLWVILLISGLNGVVAIYSTWTLPTAYTGKTIFAAIGMTILLLELTIALMYGAATAKEPEDQRQRSVY